MALLDRLFKLRRNGTTVPTELRAGVTTFLTMSYIVFVQPIILASTGLSWHTVFVATCLSAAAGTLLMGFLANYPIALAAAMGHNVLFAKFCRDGTVNWQTGLGAVCVSGIIFVLLSLWGVREKIINAIPASIKHAIAVGIGLLIAFLGFQWAGLTVSDPAVLVRIGDLHLRPVLLAAGGLLFTSALIALRVRGAILLGIVVTAAVGVPLGITSTDAVKQGVLSDFRPRPMQRVALLPVQVQEDPRRLASNFATELDGAAGRHYERGRVVSVTEVQKKLEAAGVVIPPDPAPERLARIAHDTLECSLVVLPKVTPPDKTATNRTLSVEAYEVVLDSEGKKVTGGKLWRKYLPVPTTASEEQLRRYADDVILGLPGHQGLLRLDILGALKLGLLHVIFIFFFLDLFDTIGTLVGVSQQAGLMREGKLPRARGALLADAMATVIGAGLGTSTVTSYIESSAGVAEGGRTGLANVVTALLFIAALFFAPVVEMVGGAHATVVRGGTRFLYPAVAPVLIIIGSIMLRNVVHIVWTDPTEALPAFLAIMVMPLTFSITDGIAFGFISYSFLKLVSGRGREVHWIVYLFSLLFIVRYAYVGT